MLTVKQIDQYRRDGYVIPDFGLPTETIDTIKEHHQRFVECYPQFVDYCPAVLAYDLGFLNYARQPEILDMVEQLLGPNIALWNSSFLPNLDAKGSKRRGIKTENIGRFDHWLPAPSGLPLIIPLPKTVACRSSRDLTGIGN